MRFPRPCLPRAFRFNARFRAITRKLGQRAFSYLPEKGREKGKGEEDREEFLFRRSLIIIANPGVTNHAIRRGSIGRKNERSDRRNVPEGGYENRS